MTEPTASHDASTPPPPDGEGPFADIIEIFRGIAEGSTARSSVLPRPRPAEGAPTREVGAVDDARATTATLPSVPVIASKSRRRLPVVVAGVAAVAVAAAGGVVLSRGSDQPAAPSTPRVLPAPSGQPSAQQQYAGLLAAVTAAPDLRTLSAVAGQARAVADRFAGPTDDTPGQQLIAAETAHLQALAALDTVDTIDTVDPADAEAATAGLPAELRALRSSAARVRQALHALPAADPAADQSADPTASVDHVLDLVAPAALRAGSRRLTALLDAAAAATRTADLRTVARQAAASRSRFHDVAASLRGHPTGVRATRLQRAFAALAALRTIDGDHLDAWPRVRPRLAAPVHALGLDTGPLDRVDAVVASAGRRMEAWHRLGERPVEPTRADVSAYSSRMGAALDRYARAMATLPAVGASQHYDFALTMQIRDALDAVTGARRAVLAVGDVPPRVRAAHRALVALTLRGETVARRVDGVARAVEVCLGAACGFGDMRGWAAYQSALARVGDLAAARAGWAAAVAAAGRAAPVTRPPAPAKPVV